MTKQEYKNVVRVHGKHFRYYDVPAYIRKREEEENRLKAQAEDQAMDEARQEEEREYLLREEERRLA